MRNKEDPCQPRWDFYRIRNIKLDKGQTWSVAAQESFVALSHVAENFLLRCKISKTGNLEEGRLLLS